MYMRAGEHLRSQMDSRAAARYAKQDACAAAFSHDSRARAARAEK